MVMFGEVAAVAEALAGTASRLKKRAAIEAGLKLAHEAAPESRDAGLFALYLAGQPFAENDSRKLNAGGALLSRAVLAVSGASDAALTAAYRRHVFSNCAQSVPEHDFGEGESEARIS